MHVPQSHKWVFIVLACLLLFSTGGVVFGFPPLFQMLEVKFGDVMTSDEMDSFSSTLSNVGSFGNPLGAVSGSYFMKFLPVRTVCGLACIMLGVGALVITLVFADVLPRFAFYPAYFLIGVGGPWGQLVLIQMSCLWQKGRTLVQSANAASFGASVLVWQILYEVSKSTSLVTAWSIYVIWVAVLLVLCFLIFPVSFVQLLNRWGEEEGNETQEELCPTEPHSEDEDYDVECPISRATSAEDLLSPSAGMKSPFKSFAFWSLLSAVSLGFFIPAVLYTQGFFSCLERALGPSASPEDTDFYVFWFSVITSCGFVAIPLGYLIGDLLGIDIMIIVAWSLNLLWVFCGTSKNVHVLMASAVFFTIGKQAMFSAYYQLLPHMWGYHILSTMLLLGNSYFAVASICTFLLNKLSFAKALPFMTENSNPGHAMAVSSLVLMLVFSYMPIHILIYFRRKCKSRPDLLKK